MKSRPVFGVLLVILAFYAIYLYDTGRWNLIRAAITSPPGTVLPPGYAPGYSPGPVANQAGGGTILPPGNHPSIGPSPEGSGALPPALPSIGGIGPASWLSAGQALIQQIWPATPAPATPVPAAPYIGGFTPGIIT